MSDLTGLDKRKLERLLDMGGGYVLNFSNRTFADFVMDSTGKDIDDSKYNYGSGSKANRLRGFWKEEPNFVVGKLMRDLLVYVVEINPTGHDALLLAECQRAVTRLVQDTPVPELDALKPNADDSDFEMVASQVRDAIERNKPEAGLDRLHTFVIKFVRTLCVQRGVVVTKEKALHSLFGEYVKKLREQGAIDSEMTERILKSSISILEAFNRVRNEQSLAHDNPVLNYEESLLIFNHVTSSIRFLRELESRSQSQRLGETAMHDDDD